MPYYLNLHDEDGGEINGYEDEEFSSPREAQDFLDSFDGSDSVEHGVQWIGGIVVDEDGKEVEVPPKEKDSGKKKPLPYGIRPLDKNLQPVLIFGNYHFLTVKSAKQYLDGLGFNGYVVDRKTGNMVGEVINNKKQKVTKKEEGPYGIDVLTNSGNPGWGYDDLQFSTAKEARAYLDRLGGNLGGYVVDKSGNILAEKLNIKKTEAAKKESLPYRIYVLDSKGRPVTGYEKPKFSTVERARAFLDCLPSGIGGTVTKNGVTVNEKQHNEKLAKAKTEAAKKVERPYGIYVMTADHVPVAGYEKMEFATVKEARAFLGGLSNNRVGSVIKMNEKRHNEKLELVTSYKRTLEKVKENIEKTKKESLPYQIYVLDRLGTHLKNYDGARFATIKEANEYLSRMTKGYTGFVANLDGIMVNRYNFKGKAINTRDEEMPCLIEVCEEEKIYGYLNFETIKEARNYLDSLDGKHDHEEFSIGKHILDIRGNRVE